MESPKELLGKVVEQKFKSNTELNEDWDKLAEHIKPLVECDEKMFDLFKKVNTRIHWIGFEDLMLVMTQTAQHLALTKMMSPFQVCSVCGKKLDGEKNE